MTNHKQIIANIISGILQPARQAIANSILDLLSKRSLLPFDVLAYNVDLALTIQAKGAISDYAEIEYIDCAFFESVLEDLVRQNRVVAGPKDRYWLKDSGRCDPTED